MTRIIPGVQVTVVKEVVPPQLAPSGVLGIIGITEKVPETTKRASSWSTFIDIFGPGSAFSMPEARHALQNGAFQLVVCPVGADKGTEASVVIPLQWPEIKAVKEGNKVISKALPVKEDKLILTARAAGVWANQLKAVPVTRTTADGQRVFDLSIQRPDGEYEMHRNLSLTDGNVRHVHKALEDGSAIAKSADTSKNAAAGTLVDTNDPSAGKYYELVGGADAGAADYASALMALRDEPDVDMVLAAVQDFSNTAKVSTIYDNIISHCQNMSTDSKGRIGFGQVPPDADSDMAKTMINNLVSDRFVLLAPHGVVGAVAGKVGGLSYFQSPTFKNVAGLGAFDPRLTVDDQRELLKAHVVPVVNERGRGIIVLRGLTTDGDQINVRRVADRAVRGVKMIGDLFIGRLNTADGRTALKQKLVEFLVQMEKDGAIVPSTDGSDPAFKVDVYSSQADFALGVVRIDMAVRPVRAIDFIYATVLVQV